MLERDWIGFDPDNAVRGAVEAFEAFEASLDADLAERARKLPSRKAVLGEDSPDFTDPWADWPATPADPYPDPTIPGTEV